MGLLEGLWVVVDERGLGRGGIFSVGVGICGLEDWMR